MFRTFIFKIDRRFLVVWELFEMSDPFSIKIYLKIIRSWKSPKIVDRGFSSEISDLSMISAPKLPTGQNFWMKTLDRLFWTLSISNDFQENFDTERVRHFNQFSYYQATSIDLKIKGRHLYDVRYQYIFAILNYKYTNILQLKIQDKLRIKTCGAKVIWLLKYRCSNFSKTGC